MGQRHHVVDIGIFRQQLGADLLHRIFERALHALDRGRDAQDIFGADRTIGVAEALEGEAFERRQRRGHCGRDFELVERWRLGHADARFIDPLTGWNERQRMADHLAIADDRRALGDIDERRLVALRHEGAKFKPAREARPRRQAEIVDDDRDIVLRVELDVAGLLGHDFPLAHRRCSSDCTAHASSCLALCRASTSRPQRRGWPGRARP